MNLFTCICETNKQITLAYKDEHFLVVDDTSGCEWAQAKFRHSKSNEQLSPEDSCAETPPP